MTPRTAAVCLSMLVALVLSACDGSDPAPADSTSASSPPPRGSVGQHEVLSGSPISFGLSVPGGATQLGPLVRRRSAGLVATYRELLAKAERLDAIKRQQAALAAAADGKTVSTPTPTPSALPSRDSYTLLDAAPPPDLTTSMMRVDGSPDRVFQAVLEQVARSIPSLLLEPARWSQYCAATDGFYTGCTATFSGRTTDDKGVRIAVTLDPGDAATSTAPAGSDLRPVMTVTTYATDPPDTSKALADTAPTTQPPSEATPSVPATSNTPGPPAPQGPEVAARWPTMTTERPSAPGDPILTSRWLMRDDETLLLSGDRPAFALVVIKRTTNADAVARSYVLPFSTAGRPRQDILEDRNEISTTYTAARRPGDPVVSATYVQSGRGNYVALSYRPVG